MRISQSILSAAAALTLALTGCGSRNHSDNSATATEPVDSMIAPRYAEGFRVSSAPGGVTLLDISDPEGREAQTFHFALVPKDADAEIPEGYTRINTPVNSVVCMTSLQLSNFIRLGLTDKVKGITSTRHLFNPDMRRRLADGRTHRIGIEGNFDNEVLMAIQPDIIMISPFKRGGYDALRNTGVTLLPHLGYKELSPLGQAEWIKVAGLLTGESRRAAEIFNEIESNYNRLCHLTDSVGERPKVFSGQMQGGHWYAVGGRSFLAHLFRDAGADYFLADNEESGGVTIDYEKVYADASDADYWRIVNSFDGDYSYDALRSEDARYVDFKAWRDHGVIYCNMKQVPFYESMPVEPDKVLADFIAVFHPSLLPDHKPTYYSLLK